MKKALMLASVPSMIEQFNMNNIKILNDLGYEVDVACNFIDGGTLNKERVEEFKQELEAKNINYYNVSINRSPFSTNNIKAYNEIKKIIKDNDYDIIHLHSPMGGVCGRLACKNLKLKKTKVIYTAHGFHFYKGAPKKNWIMFYPIEKWLSKYTDCLITINKEDYEIAKRKFKAKKVELVNGVGVNTEKFSFSMNESEKENLKNSLGLKKDDFIIIYVAELNIGKNQGMLIEAVRSLTKKYSNIKVLLIGKDSMNGYYQNKVNETNLTDKILFLGYRKDVPSLMKIANLAVSTSIREGLPVNIMEAMVCNLPIIVTNCRGNRDLIENQKSGKIVEIGDVMSLEKEIETIYNNENRVAEYDIVSYTQNYIEEQMEKIYLNREGETL